MEEIKSCPECGCPLIIDYERGNGQRVYYCPNGREQYIFEKKHGYEYAVCLYTGQRFLVGAAK